MFLKWCTVIPINQYCILVFYLVCSLLLFNAGDKINSICLPDHYLNLPEGHKCYAAGWGATSPDISSLPVPVGFMDFYSFIFPTSRPCGLGQSSNNPRCSSPKQPLKLLEVDLPLVSLRRCRRTFRNLREWVHVCAGGKGKVNLVDYIGIKRSDHFPPAYLFPKKL